MDHNEIRKSFRENEITRIFWKRGLAVITAVFVFSFTILAFLVSFSSYTDTSDIRLQVAEKFLSGGIITQEWFHESFGTAFVLDSRESPCNKTELRTDRQGEGWVCNGKSGLSYSVTVSLKDTISYINIIGVVIGALVLSVFMIYSDWKGFVEKGQFYNFDGLVLGTKLNEAYTKILKDIEDVESDDFNNLADRLYFLLKQDIWIQNRDKNFYMKVTNEVLKQCDRHLLYEESVRFFMIQKSIEREIYIKKKQWWRYCTSLISLTVSRHFTSALQLFVFLMIFTFANSSVVGIITESSNIIKNFNDTLATLDNTGAGVVCTLNAWYVFNIYLQLVGMILFGTFVNVLQQKIKR